MESLGFSIYNVYRNLQINISANSDSSSSFPTQVPFVSFSSLIAQGRTSNTVLNKNESGHPCLMPNLRVRAFSCLSLSILWPCHYGLYYIEVCYLCTCSVESFVNGCWILSEAFSAFIEMIIWFLSFILLIGIYHVDLHMLSHTSIHPCGLLCQAL